MIQGLMSVIGAFIYNWFGVLFWFIDLLQAVFYALAGVGGIKFGGTPIYSTNAGGEENTGLIYYLLTTPMIRNLLISIIVLAVFLLIIFTAMAFIKNAYASKQKNWQEIVGNAFKGLANFIFIPVCCLLGVWLSNILLVAINGATSTGGSTMMSRKLFICSAYNANKYRSGDINVDENEAQKIEAFAKSNGLNIEVQVGEDGEYYAAIIDQVYAQGKLDIADGDQVEQHYELIDINYLILIAGGVFMLYVLVSVAYAMIKRMFILLMLFVISPALCSMYPLDEGKVVGSWKAEFIKYVISAYGAVVAMNLFFSILPIVNQIDVVSAVGVNWGSAQFLLNDIFQILIMISGLFVAKEFIGLISGWIGGDNALTAGENMKKSATGALKKYATGTMKTTGAFMKNTGRIVGSFKNGGFGAGLATSLRLTLGSGLNAIDKAAFGGEAGKIFDGIGFRKYDEEGKLIKNQFSAGAKAEKERLSTIKTSQDTEAQRKAFVKGSGEKQLNEMLKEISEQTNLTSEDRLKMINEAVSIIAEKGSQSNVSTAEVEDIIMKALNANGDIKKDILASSFKSDGTDIDVQDVRFIQKEGDRQRNRLVDSGLDDLMKKKADAEQKTKEGSNAAGTLSDVEQTKLSRDMYAQLQKIAKKNSTQIVSITEESAKKIGEAVKKAEDAKSSMNKIKDSVKIPSLKDAMIEGKEITASSINSDGAVQNAIMQNNKVEIEDFNRAVQDKAKAEKEAKAIVDAYVKAMQEAVKGNKAAEKMVEDFAKTLKGSVKEIEEFIKKLAETKKQ